MKHEIQGNLELLMGTLVAEPVYHFWGDNAFVLEGRTAVRGFYENLIAGGGTPIGDDDLILTTTQLITVWPAGADAKLVGEDIYFGHSQLRNARRIRPEALPDYYRLST
jgi:hypothetical protein